MPLFITLEGGEGCGKSLQAKRLYRKLTQKGITSLLTQEPGGTPMGKRITYWLKWQDGHRISAMAELMLFNASRAELVNKVIRPALEEGQIVICDRYTDSTLAYQGYGRGIDLGFVKALNNAASGSLKPDLTILLDIPHEEGLGRKKKARDRFEQEEATFHRRVRQGYLKLAAEEPQRWLVIDATQSKDRVATLIWQKVSAMLAPED